MKQKNNGSFIEVADVTLRYENRLILQQVNFSIGEGDIFVIMGPSGCGKSTLMKSMIGLHEPSSGRVVIDQVDYWRQEESGRDSLRRHFGVLYQSGALWSSMTLAENVELVLAQFSQLSETQRQDVVAMKLALVGLAGYEDYYPSQVSGGMRKRAALARAMAADPKILFLDEPSAGLDPVSAYELDELILHIKESFNTTIVLVTHELASIFAVASSGVYLDPESKSVLASGDPREMLAQTRDARVRNFLTRGGTDQSFRRA